MNRLSPYSRKYQLVDTPAGSILIPILKDLPSEFLQWHSDWAIDNEDYEYAHAVHVEAEARGVAIEI